ncbi:unnamed protein product [Linum tenue]|uniref:Uncharacterized protein n=1 Tax=Linum tenue TaxID=586396 RepID=A0AAV0KP58_9ROSI|nr:unnamed protein product [Linum tenue]
MLLTLALPKREFSLLTSSLAPEKRPPASTSRILRKIGVLSLSSSSPPGAPSTSVE